MLYIHRAETTTIFTLQHRSLAFIGILQQYQQRSTSYYCQNRKQRKTETLINATQNAITPPRKHKALWSMALFIPGVIEGGEYHECKDIRGILG